MAPGAVASAVAREAGIQASQLFRWRRQLHGAQRFGSLPLEVPTVAARITASPTSPGVIEIEFKTGVRLRICDAASDQFIFEKGHDKVADVKPDMIETDHAVADIRHLLHTAHDANAVGALDPNHTTAPQDMTKVQLPHHHGDFHFA